MSEKPDVKAAQKGKQPDWRGMLQPAIHDPRVGMAESLIRHDKDLHAKTRIPHVAAMTMLDVIGPWGSTKKDFSVMIAGKLVTYPKTLAGMLEFFGERFRVNALSKGEGQSRQEYVNVSIAYLAQEIANLLSVPSRLEEGSKKR